MKLRKRTQLLLGASTVALLFCSGAAPATASGNDQLPEPTGIALIPKSEPAPWILPETSRETLAIFSWIYPYTLRSVIENSLVTTNYRSPSSFSSCSIGTTGGTCSITSGKGASRTVQLALGISRSEVTGQLGISNSTTVTTTVSRSSPPLKAGSTWRAYAIGSRYKYKFKATTFYAPLSFNTSTSNWLYAFSPNPARIHCQ